MGDIQNNHIEPIEVEETNLKENVALIPSWLTPFLSKSYFERCSMHSTLAKSECNMFCLICKGNPQCSFCMKLNHNNHPFVQVRRSSYSDVVRLDDMRQYIDASNIEIYRINGYPVIFLNRRCISKPTKGSSPVCLICNKNMIVPFKFCSLHCKLEGVKKGIKEVTFELPNVMDNERMGNGFVSEWIRLPLSPPSSPPPPLPTPTSTSTSTTMNGDEDSRSSDKTSGSNPPPPSPANVAHGYRSRSRILKRKGIPSRAPFF